MKLDAVEVANPAGGALVVGDDELKGAVLAEELAGEVIGNQDLAGVECGIDLS